MTPQKFTSPFGGGRPVKLPSRSLIPKDCSPLWICEGEKKVREPSRVRKPAEAEIMIAI